VSDDNGVTERTVVLPQAPGENGAEGPHSVAADGDNLLAVAYSGRTPQVWASVDGGGSWTFSALPTLPVDSEINGIQWVAGHWLLYGMSQDGLAPNAPLLLTGLPGKWTIENRRSSARAASREERSTGRGTRS
jgi:hypothetical protein